MDENAFLCRGMESKLYRASRWGDAKLLDEVLEEGRVDVFQEVTPAGDTALHTAAFNGHAEVASKLIELALDNPEAGMVFLKAQNRDGITALHAAARRGWEEIVKLLVEKDKDLACVKDNPGETALFKAVDNGHVDIVECLLNCSKCTAEEHHYTRTDGITPLHLAVSKLHTGVTWKLLEKRPVLVDKADNFQRTALHILAFVHLVDTGLFQRILIFQSRKRDKIIGHIAQMLLDKESSLLYRVDVNGQSALHLGAKEGNDPLVKTMLRYGDDFTQISDKEGRTALHLAVEHASEVYERVGPYNLKNIISSLTLTSLINRSENNGQTAWEIAIQKATEEGLLFWSIARYLRRHGARVTINRQILGIKATPLKSYWRMDIVSVNAVLIATVAFAAAFTLPGNLDTNAKSPVPLLLNVSLFKFFIIFDSLAFCISIGTAVLIIYAFFGNEEDHYMTTVCVNGLWVALIFIALAFGAAIHLVVASRCMWLAVLVWTMVCYLPIGLRLMTIQGKGLLFEESRNFMLYLFLIPLSVMVSMWWVIGVPLYIYFLVCLWGYLIRPARTMVVRMLS